MASKENKVQKDILTYLKQRGVFCWRNNNTAIFDKQLGIYRAFQGIKGVGDILGILPNGRFLSVECKSATGKASPDQILFIKHCTALGGTCFVARSVEDVAKKLDI